MHDEESEFRGRLKAVFTPTGGEVESQPLREMLQVFQNVLTL